MERVWLKSYPSGVPTEIDPETFRSLAEFLAASVAKHRRRTAFISMGRAMSYAQLDRLSRDFASYLQNVARLPRGARVAVMLPNEGWMRVPGPCCSKAAISAARWSNTSSPSRKPVMVMRRVARPVSSGQGSSR